ncbi:MAG TPA: SUMF1/EgtB/PvdO family nonheme iron enzyme [Acidobacteriota bacterium]|nr:SUMF1/EgtB/PvdO family nonheme iron enzyme [Acidobacteriota bacterium]
MKPYTLILTTLLIGVLLLPGCSSQPDETGMEEAAPAPEETRPELGAMVVVPAGEFTMGSDVMPGTPPLAAPAHKVTLPAYEIDVYEVTNVEFARFQIESDYEAQGDWRTYYKIGREEHPVANVTWEDAKAYCEWAGKRLPTEAEWEKAARGTEGLRYPWGEVFDWTKTNTNEHGVRDVLPVGSLPDDKSPYGVYDIFGNIQEWTADTLEPYPGAKTEGLGNVYNKKYKVVRGSSYAMKGESMALWTRAGFLPNSQYGIGFRCARDVEQPGGETQTQAAASR